MTGHRESWRGEGRRRDIDRELAVAASDQEFRQEFLEIAFAFVMFEFPRHSRRPWSCPSLPFLVTGEGSFDKTPAKAWRQKAKISSIRATWQERPKLFHFEAGSLGRQRQDRRWGGTAVLVANAC